MEIMKAGMIDGEEVFFAILFGEIGLVASEGLGIEASLLIFVVD